MKNIRLAVIAAVFVIFLIENDLSAQGMIKAADKKEAANKLSRTRCAVHYRYVTDGMRSLDKVINIFKETRADFIVLGWARINLIPETCSDLPAGDQDRCRGRGYSYEHLQAAAAEIKSALPDVILGGGISAEFLNPVCRNELTAEELGKDRTWPMALDPQKWGIKMTREEFQTKVAISHGWAGKNGVYNPKEQMLYYFPDQTNPDYQKLFLSWVKKQINCGVDEILIDINTKQAKLLAELAGDPSHIAVKDSLAAAAKIVDEIHQYGFSIGRYIYVVSWATAALLRSPYPAPDLDAVMTTFSTQEISALKIDEAKWNVYVAKIKEKMGEIPIFVMFDQGPDYRPLEAFSQRLDKKQQREFLRMADAFCRGKGLIFVYPLHGGMMGLESGLKTRSYEKFNWYDSLAPEFDTYETIKSLAGEKAELKNRGI